MATQTLTDEQLAELLPLIQTSDSVELKLTVPDSDIRSTSLALGLDPLDAQIRQVVFFDTPDLQLNRQGLVVRARRIQGGQGDTVIKLRPVTPNQLSPEVRESKNLGVEVDAMPGGFTCSASMKGKTSAKAVRRCLNGKDDIKGLFSKEQRSFFKDRAPDGLKLNDLVALGPIFILKLKTVTKDAGRKTVVELWLYPDGSRILELSTKCAPDQAFDVAAAWRVELGDLGLDLTGEQQTKTKAALEYFSNLIKEG